MEGVAVSSLLPQMVKDVMARAASFCYLDFPIWGIALTLFPIFVLLTRKSALKSLLPFAYFFYNVYLCP